MILTFVYVLIGVYMLALILKALDPDPQTVKVRHERKAKEYFVKAEYLAKHVNSAISNTEEVLLNYDKALEYNGLNSRYWFKRGLFKRLIQDYKGALDDITRAIEIFDEFGEYWYERSITHRLAGNLDSYSNDLIIAANLNYNQAKLAITPLEYFSFKFISSPVEIKLNAIGVKAVYHITHINNLYSILINGLHSRNSQRLNNISFSKSVFQTNNDSTEDILDLKNDCIHFYFNPKNNDMFRQSEIQDELVVIEVDLNALYQSNYIFYEEKSVANYGNKNTYIKDVSNLNRIRLNYIFSEKQAKLGFEQGNGYELAIKNYISSVYIKKVNFYNQIKYDAFIKNNDLSVITKLQINRDLFFSKTVPASDDLPF